MTTSALDTRGDDNEETKLCDVGEADGIDVSRCLRCDGYGSLYVSLTVEVESDR